jgi:hypothetical protein
MHAMAFRIRELLVNDNGAKLEVPDPDDDQVAGTGAALR